MREGNEVTGNVVQIANSYIQIGSGPTSTRPAVPLAGMMRWNTTLVGWDTYDGTNWDTHAWASLTGADSVPSESMHFVYDTTRSKYLSAQDKTINYQSLSAHSNDFVYPSATAFSSDVGTIMPYKGTITGLTAYLSNTNKCIRSVTVFTGAAGATSNLSVFTFGNATLSGTFSATASNINLDFAAGDLIKIQLVFSSGSSGNAWTNLNMTMHYKWRN